MFTPLIRYLESFVFGPILYTNFFFNIIAINNSTEKITSLGEKIDSDSYT